jgi:hypothetical protein
MISIRDTFLLAQTKLRTRKVRLFITVFVSSLLFACLVFASIVTTGVIGSIASFSKEGYGGKYLVQATPLTYSPNPSSDSGLLESLRPEQREIIAKKTAAAKKLGIEYDPSTDMSLPITDQVNPDGSKQSFVNYDSVQGRESLKSRNDAIPNTSYTEFQKLATEAGATATYKSTSPQFAYARAPGTTQVITNGKEKLIDPTQNQPKQTGIDSIQTFGWRSMDTELLKPFALPGQSLDNSDRGIPVIAPFSAAEEILGLKSLPETATSKEKLARLTEVREKIAGKEFQLCYRNAKSAELALTALQTQTEIEKNKTNKDYVSPPIIYNLPKIPCSEITVKTDKRNAEEKSQQKKQDDFNKQFGTYVEPKQGLISVRIAGLSPDMNFESAINASTILSSLFSSSVGGGWVSPSQLIIDNPLASQAQGGNTETIARESINYIAEFPNLDMMKQFIKGQECSSAQVITVPGGGSFVTSSNGQDPIVECIKQNKTLVVTTFGNSAGAIDEFEKTIWSIGRILVLVIVVLSSLIMMANIGKIIADSRRETAVFRALGARRFDITQIYLIYAVLLALIIFGFALVLGLIASLYIDSKYSSNFSTAAVLIYNAQDTTKEFKFFGINMLQLGGMVLLAIATGLVSALLPLLTNMRRNPINDMRDER